MAMANTQSISSASSSAQLDRQITEMVRKLNEIRATEVPQAFATGLNKAGTQASTQIVRGIAADLALQQKLIRKRVYLKRATRNRLEARIRSFYRGINLIDLKPRDTGKYKKGVRGRVGSGVRARGGHHYYGGWIAKSPRGQRLAFERGFKRGGKTPIDVLRIPIKAEVDRIAPRATRQVIDAKLPQLIAHELQFRIRKHQEKR